MSKKRPGAFLWQTRSQQEIPDDIDVLVATSEFEGPLVARSDGNYLWGNNGETLDWDLIRWWTHIPPTPDKVTIPRSSTQKT